MWPSSLVGRLLLSALIGVLFASATAAVFQWSYVHLRGADDMISAELEDELDNIEQRLVVGQGGVLSFMPTSSPDSYDALRKDTAFRIVDASGISVLSSLDGPALQALERMPPGTERLEVRDEGMPVSLRVLERIVVRSGIHYRLQVARSNRMVERLEQYARKLYLGSAVATILLALAVFTVVVYATVRRTVVPLKRASELAAKIGPGALSARLHVEGIPSEMQPLIDALNSALERVEQGFKVQQEFIAMAAHELKTPLTLLQAELELGSGMDTAAMLQDTQLMARQVNQLLHLAEVSEVRNYRFSPNSLHALGGSAASYMSRKSERSEVSLRVECRGPDVWVNADAGAVFVMLKNLLENAINHSPEGGCVTLDVSPAGFEVADEGPGIAPMDVEHLFKRFWRASTTTGGAGLGLAIVHEICDAHRWEIAFEDDPSGGARFVVRIPIVGVDAAMPSESAGRR